MLFNKIINFIQEVARSGPNNKLGFYRNTGSSILTSINTWEEYQSKLINWRSKLFNLSWNFYWSWSIEVEVDLNQYLGGRSVEFVTSTDLRRYRRCDVVCSSLICVIAKCSFSHTRRRAIKAEKSFLLWKIKIVVACLQNTLEGDSLEGPPCSRTNSLVALKL